MDSETLLLGDLKLRVQLRFLGIKVSHRVEGNEERSDLLAFSCLPWKRFDEISQRALRPEEDTSQITARNQVKHL